MGGQLLRALENECWEVEVVRCLAVHILQTHTSVPGQKSDTVSHESSGVFGSADPIPSLPPSPSLPCAGAELSPFQLPAFLFSTVYILGSSLLQNTHLEGGLA